MSKEVINNYAIEDHLGSGGFSDVWLCTDLNSGKKYAIKIIERKLANNPKFRERFRNSYQILRPLNHPNLVQIVELIDTPDDLALVMEYIEGINLDEFIPKNYDPANPLNLLPFFEHILDALGYSHQNKIIHRDIKPSNILIDKKDFTIKLIDFDTVKDFNVDSSFTSTNFTIGTFGYISPEQLENSRNVTAQSDIYSLGLLLFYMLIGKPYFDKNQRHSIADMANRIKNEPLPQINLLNRNIPDVFDKILKKATEKQAKNRFKSCEEFKQYLHESTNPYTNTDEIDVDKTQVVNNGVGTPEGQVQNSTPTPTFDPDKTAFITHAENLPQKNQTVEPDKTQMFSSESPPMNDFPPIDRTQIYQNDSTQIFEKEKKKKNNFEETEVFSKPNNQPPQPTQHTSPNTVDNLPTKTKSSLKIFDLLILIGGVIVFIIGMYLLYLKSNK